MDTAFSLRDLALGYNGTAVLETGALDLPARDTLLPRVYFYLGQAHERKGENLLAAQRAREIASGASLTVERDDDKNPVIALREIADAHGLKVVEDSCDALGLTLRGTPTGTRADISLTSFALSHIITAAGTGGMVCVDDEDLAEMIRELRAYDPKPGCAFSGAAAEEVAEPASQTPAAAEPVPAQPTASVQGVADLTAGLLTPVTTAVAPVVAPVVDATVAPIAREVRRSADAGARGTDDMPQG